MKELKTPIRVFPWGGELYKEVNLNPKSVNKLYVRHGKTAEGLEYIEVSKYGPILGGDGTTYIQKLRIHSLRQWEQIKEVIDGEMADSIGWDIK